MAIRRERISATVWGFSSFTSANWRSLADLSWIFLALMDSNKLLRASTGLAILSVCFNWTVPILVKSKLAPEEEEKLIGGGTGAPGITGGGIGASGIMTGGL